MNSSKSNSSKATCTNLKKDLHYPSHRNLVINQSRYLEPIVTITTKRIKLLTLRIEACTKESAYRLSPDLTKNIKLLCAQS